MSEDEQFFVGIVKAIFYENPDNMFKIFTIDIKETNTDWTATDIVVTGSFGNIVEEEEYRFTGQMVDHPKYGKQFQAKTYKRSRPNGRKGLINFFSSEEFPGIGKKKAEKIVDELGENAIDKILNDPNSLDFLDVKEDKKDFIIDQIKKNHQTEQILFQLNNYGFGNVLSTRIFQKYGPKTNQIITENPYQLVLDIKGIGFQKADELAKKLNIEDDDPRRVKGAIIQIMAQVGNSTGDTYLLLNDLKQMAQNILANAQNLSEMKQKIDDAITELVNETVLIVEDDRVFQENLYNAEWSIVETLKMINGSFKGVSWKDKDFQTEITEVQDNFKVKYDDSQLEAIEQSLKSPIFILTGGPGTGKTTIINGIVATYSKLNDETLDPSSDKYSIALAAPTGRAAKKLTESTGLPAMTIHRLLGLTGTADDEFAEPSLDCKLLIIDEMSMVDTLLFKTLIHAVQPGTQVVLVGDMDQLPSVGAGQVFTDLIDSKGFKTTRLENIHRQNDDSTIIELAHEINVGKVSEDIFANQSDRSFIDCNSRDIPEVVSQIIKRSSDRGFDTTDVQVLAPMYRGNAGIDNLNETIQNVLNPLTPKKKEVKMGNINYRIGDKVVYLVNTPDENVFNGEIGEIKGIILAKENVDKVDQLVIDFDGNEIILSRKDWINITLAYCTSIHKAQGSEFEMVILPLVNEEERMLKRNLLYTAVTRAKRLLVMVGNRSAFERAIVDQSARRNTALLDRIIEVFKLSKKSKTQKETPEIKSTELTVEMVMSQSIDPMIGMEDITPYDFQKKEA
ncbi:SF1B family DNA helicase RecD2 [Companilactobacillus metriopterae]|uniref:SF1B family DNA helicase RecD2 n=1 Tax=Companilactobacillus metriopterae TaxID=1909267 RepID=UPI00100AE263|nr:ATP-dependent RecD-like DNA helicase [Companilactobacillus metriopterae]